MEWKKYLTEAEREFIVLHDLFITKFMSGEIANDATGKLFLEQVKTIETDIRKKAEQQANSAEDNKKKREEKREAHCPACDKMVKTKIIGEGQNTLKQRTYKYECKSCGKEFIDFFPIDANDQLAWYDNFVNIMLAPREEGSLAEKYELPPEEIEKMKAARTNLFNVIQAEQKAMEIIEIANNQLEVWIKEINKSLYTTYGNLLATQNKSSGGKQYLN
jgi:DNA-directed RNA polymerase subunit RPC12/RpoP